MFHPRAAMIVAILAMLPTGCGDGDEGVSSGTTPQESTSSSLVTETPLSLDPATLTESWGCGYAFNQSDEDQTVAIAVSYQGDGGTFDDPLADASLPLEEIALPDPAWSVQYRTGSNLYANHCDDVIEASEPTPEVVDAWDATAGMLIINDHDTAGTSSTIAVLTDATFTGPDGDEISIPEIALENTGWGMFAG